MKAAGIVSLAIVLGCVVAGGLPVTGADDSEDRVMVTRPGVVFHRSGSDDIRGRASARTIDSALEAGYTPCRVCFGKELGALGVGTASPAGGRVGAFDGLPSVGLPAPPTSTVTQPFGVKTRTVRGGPGSREAVRDPYARYGGSRVVTESGAYEQR